MIKMGSFDTDYHIDLNFLKVYCHHCSAVMSAPPEDGGKPLQCHSCGEFHIVPKSRFAPSIVIADFVLQSEIGVGGCGTVFLAYQISLDRYCALKILHNRILSEETYLHELMQEGRLAGKLNHPNIVQCYAIGEEDKIYYYAMEYVDGKSLKEILNDKWRMSPNKAIDIIIQIAGALNYAWSKERLVHRDIKPDNIMINLEGEAKLTDLGLAIPADAIQPDDEDTIKGSPQYISPEQLLDEEQDFRSDIYSLGAVFFHMITGHFVFKAKTAMEICQMHVDTPAPSPAELAPELPPELCQIILKMLEKKPENRYRDYESLKADLLKAKLIVDTNTASQELPGPIKKEDTVIIEKPVQHKSEATPFHWALSIGSLIAFACVCYFFIFPQFIKNDAAKPKSEMVQAISQPEKETEILPKAPPAQPKAVVKISSLMVDPEGYDNGREWIEVSNSGDAIAKLNGWTLTDNESQSFRLDQQLKPGEAIKFIIPETSLSLNNGGDKLTLKNGNGEIVDSISYEKEDVLEGQVIIGKTNL